jgi:type IV secretion system protein TrbL
MLKLFLIAMAIMLPSVAHAADDSVIDEITASFHDQALTWESTLQDIALHTFYLLALIQLAWALIQLAFRAADLSDWTAEIVRQIFYIGFFVWLLKTETQWGPAIIESFRIAAADASGTKVFSAGDVFTIGINLASKVWAQALLHDSVWNPAPSIGLALAAFILFGCYMWICATMVLTLVQSYILVGSAVIFMAFGGSRWTNEIAITALRQTFAIGAKLFALQLVVSVGLGLMQSWSTATFDAADVHQILIEIGQALVLAVVAKSVPDMFERMFHGVGGAHGGALFGAAAGTALTVSGTVGAAGRAAATVVASGATVGASAELSAARVAGRIASGNAPRSRALAIAGGTAKETAKAAGATIGARLSGQRSQFGSGLFRQATNLSKQAEVQKQTNRDNAQPQPGSKNGP